jgi:glutamine amidotransferase
MQLLCNYSEENNTTCLGIVPVPVKKFSAQKLHLKVPQMGWNTIYGLRSDLFKNIKEESYIYNVHSFYAEDSVYTIAKCNYGIEYAAAIQKDNFYGVQFHTEKSAETGDKIIQNFLAI